MSNTPTQRTKSFAPARRVESVEEYYFSRKLKQIAALNAAGRDIISLGIGGPDRPPHQSVIDTLCHQSHQPSNHSYQPYVGIVELRDALSGCYKREYDVDLDPRSEIQPLIVSKEGILHISLAFLNAGDGVLVPNPGYPTYSSVSKLAEAEVFTYDLSEKNGWLPDFEELEKLPLERIKLMWVNYPNMPTGRNGSRELFEKLVDFARRHSIVVVNDNPYSFILNPQPMSLLSIEGAKECCIEMNSLSKSHNMAGWRVGMVASNAQFIEWILRVKSNIDSGMFRPMQLAAVEALKGDRSWYEELNGVYSKRRSIAARIMDELGCKWSHDQVGLFLWGRIPDGEESAEVLCDRILDEARVFITPGFIFGEAGERYIRISLCATEERMVEALDRIKEIK